MAKKQFNENNLKPVRTIEEARERGRKGGLASVEARRNKRTMRETAKMLMQMEVVGERNQQNLENFGISKEDRTYSTAVVVRLMQKALVEGDIAASRLLGELSGELAYGGSVPIEDNIIEATLVKANINLPDNGRDRVNRENLIAPQAGPQTAFMTSSADIVVYGGAAGGGKTYALLMEPLRHKDVKGFNGIVFRHNYVQITSPGGLWDSSQMLYGQVEGAESHKTPRFHWSFTDKAKLG